MTIMALHTAATGINYQSKNIDVIANNIANATTNGFKAQRLHGEDLFYLELQQVGQAAEGGRPAPLQLGLGVRPTSTSRNFLQGSLIETNQPLDMAIEGQGFFRVQTPPDIGNGFAYTRDGHFNVDSDGTVVTADGYRLDPPIDIPADAVQIQIQPNGLVNIHRPGGVVEQQGPIQLTNFVNPSGMVAQGQNLFVESEASGPPVGPNDPLTNGLGKLQQGYLEASNVEIVTEVVELIKSQRAFEFNSQTIQASDQALSVIANLRR